MGRASEEGITGEFDIMLRWFRLAATLFVALTPTITETAFSTPLPAASQYPEVQNSNFDVPLCYIQIADGRTLDLQKLCGKTSPASNSPSNRISPASNSLSSRTSVPIFRRGSGNAYASDSR